MPLAEWPRRPCPVWLGGQWLCGEVADDLADVVYCGVEGPFAACSGQEAAGESSEAQVVFGVPERSFGDVGSLRSEEHTSELQSLMRSSYAVLCLKKNKHTSKKQDHEHQTVRFFVKHLVYHN